MAETMIPNSRPESKENKVRVTVLSKGMLQSPKDVSLDSVF